MFKVQFVTVPVFVVMIAIYRTIFGYFSRNEIEFDGLILVFGILFLFLVP